MKIAIAMFIVVFGASAALAHSGGTNAQGCHNETATNSYHCH